MAPNDFWIATTEDGSGLIVRLSGELDMAGAEEVRRFVDTTLAKHYTAVDFDRRDVTFIDSVGVKALLHLRRRCAEIGVEPTFRLSPRIERVLGAMGIGSLDDPGIQLAG
jgi:anti-anti-sigma factor